MEGAEPNSLFCLPVTGRRLLSGFWCGMRELREPSGKCRVHRISQRSFLRPGQRRKEEQAQTGCCPSTSTRSARGWRGWDRGAVQDAGSQRQVLEAIARCRDCRPIRNTRSAPSRVVWESSPKSFTRLRRIFAQPFPNLTTRVRTWQCRTAWDYREEPDTSRGDTREGLAADGSPEDCKLHERELPTAEVVSRIFHHDLSRRQTQRRTPPVHRRTASK